MFDVVSPTQGWLILIQRRSLSKLSLEHSSSVVAMPYYTLIRLQPSNVFSRLFPCWVLPPRSENCASTLVTPVLFSSWPWVMYCFHYLPMYLGCSLCSVLILWRCLSVCLASPQVWAASMWMSCTSSCWSVASEESRTPSTWWRDFQVALYIYRSILCM